MKRLWGKEGLSQKINLLKKLKKVRLCCVSMLLMRKCKALIHACKRKEQKQKSRSQERKIIRK